MTTTPPISTLTYNSALLTTETRENSENANEIPVISQQVYVQTDQDLKKEHLKKQLAERDETIRRQAHAIDRITQENEKLRAKITEESEANADIETTLARLQQENIELNRSAEQTRQTQEQQEIFPAYPEQVTNGFQKAGSWFKQHASFFHAGIAFSGAALCVVFPPFMIPIALTTGSLIALTYGIAKLFN